MTEYIYEREQISDGVYTAINTFIEIIRCKDCVNYYEAENYHPSGNYYSRCCKYFDSYNDEVGPDGFCAWGERRDS